MIIKTEAVALQIRPWSKTSHIVTWLTPGHGCVVTAVKGACRPKSAFLGQYDLFYTCELLFYRRERGGIHAIRECAPLLRRDPLRGDWRAAAAAAYLADLTARAVHGGGAQPQLFGDLSRALDELGAPPGGGRGTGDGGRGTTGPQDDRTQAETVLRYEVRLLHALGLLPDLAPCPDCPPPLNDWLRFSLPAGRALCAHRPPPAHGDTVISLHRAVRKRFLVLKDEMLPPPGGGRGTGDGGSGDPNVSTPLPPPENKNEENLKVSLGLSRFLGIFISFHLDVPATVRRVAMEMMDMHTSVTGDLTR